MRNLLFLFSVFLLVCGASNAAHAISYTDVYDKGPIFMSGSLFGKDKSINLDFDITDDGFKPGEQVVTGASISLNLTDDSGCWWDFWEFARLDVGVNTFRWEVDSGDVAFEIESLMTLNESGTVFAVLTATYGDFIFNSATLTAEATDPTVSTGDTTPVPEPANILLLGAGLIGLSGFMKKSKYWLGRK